MTITPINSHTEIILKTAKDVSMTASKTSDAYGLRLRFTKGIPVKKQGLVSKAINSVNNTLPTKQANELNKSYFTSRYHYYALDKKKDGSTYSKR